MERGTDIFSYTLIHENSGDIAWRSAPETGGREPTSEVAEVAAGASAGASGKFGHTVRQFVWGP